MFQRIKNLKASFIEKHFFRPSWYSILVNPYFIARFGLYRQIRQFALSVNPDSRILDVGCGLKPYRNLFKGCQYLGIDVAGGGHADSAKVVDAFFDGTTIPYPDRQFDVVICTQVLEHAEFPDCLVRECDRVLKPNGLLFLTVPFVWNEHEKPYDFRRLTQFGLKQYLSGIQLQIKRLVPTSGVFGVCGQLVTAYLFESFPWHNSILKFFLVLLICFPLQASALFLDLITRNRWITLDYVVEVVKQS